MGKVAEQGKEGKNREAMGSIQETGCGLPGAATSCCQIDHRPRGLGAGQAT